MKNINKQVDELDGFIPNWESVNEAVSASNVGWQIEHCLLVILAVIGSLKKSEPNNFKWKFTPIKYLIFWRKAIPRGKVRAPKYVSSENYDETTLKAHVETCRRELSDFEKLGNEQFFTHPIFGDLRKKEAVKFLWIHTEHHLKIIREICG